MVYTMEKVDVASRDQTPCAADAATEVLCACGSALLSTRSRTRVIRYATARRFGVWIAFATSLGVAPNPRSARISRSNDTDASPASIFATRD